VVTWVSNSRGLSLPPGDRRAGSRFRSREYVYP
jgi:hypothetical protein